MQLKYEVPDTDYRARRLDLNPTWVPPVQIHNFKRAGPKAYLDPDTQAAKTVSGTTFRDEYISAVLRIRIN